MINMERDYKCDALKLIAAATNRTDQCIPWSVFAMHLDTESTSLSRSLHRCFVVVDKLKQEQTLKVWSPFFSLFNPHGRGYTSVQSSAGKVRYTSLPP